MKNPSILRGILGNTWFGVRAEETGSIFWKALEAEKARKLEEKKKDDANPTPSGVHNEHVSKKDSPVARGWEGIVGKDTPEGEAYKRKHRDWMQHYRRGDPPEVSFNEHQMPLARRAPHQFVHVHVNNTTGSEVAINAWMAVPQPAYV